MVGKLLVMLLIGAISLLSAMPVLGAEALPEVLLKVYSTPEDYEAATGKKIEKLNEAPELRIMVAAGELPPVEERLPKDFIVIKPEEEIGQYGGTFVSYALEHRKFLQIAGEGLTAISPDGQSILPNVAKGWEYSEGNKNITLFLREGLRWSDGVPFTADDILFWYEDIILNDSLTPVISAIYKRGGEVGTLKKVDDYTVEFAFTKPYGLFTRYLGSWGGPLGQAITPKHYLKQFHPEYTPMEEIEEAMKEEGFTSWIDFFGHMNSTPWGFMNPERPVLGAWVATDWDTAPIQGARRNPYFWKVDTEGNQLPYMDRLEFEYFSNEEALGLKGLAGELDYGGHNDIALARRYAEEGNYRFVRGIWMPNSKCNILFNFNHPDPYRRELYRDVRFRQALSIAIDRDEINEFVFEGTYVPSQISPLAGPPYYGNSEMFMVWTEYDPETANQMLDEIGLAERDGEGYRLGLDGKDLTLIIYPNIGWPSESGEAMDLVKDTWAGVGIRALVKPQTGALWWAQHPAGEHDLASRASHFGGGPVHPTLNANTFALTRWEMAPLWALWMDTNGAEGFEPPDEVKRLRELWEEILGEGDEERVVALIMEAFQLHMDNLWSIGTVHNNVLDLKEVQISNRVRNVPPVIYGELYVAVPSSWFITE